MSSYFSSFFGASNNSAGSAFTSEAPTDDYKINSINPSFQPDITPPTTGPAAQIAEKTVVAVESNVPEAPTEQAKTEAAASSSWIGWSVSCVYSAYTYATQLTPDQTAADINVKMAAIFELEKKAWKTVNEDKELSQQIKLAQEELVTKIFQFSKTYSADYDKFFSDLESTSKGIIVRALGEPTTTLEKEKDAFVKTTKDTLDQLINDEIALRHASDEAIKNTLKEAPLSAFELKETFGLSPRAIDKYKLEEDSKSMFEQLDQIFGTDTASRVRRECFESPIFQTVRLKKTKALADKREKIQNNLVFNDSCQKSTRAAIYRADIPKQTLANDILDLQRNCSHSEFQAVLVSLSPQKRAILNHSLADVCYYGNETPETIAKIQQAISTLEKLIALDTEDLKTDLYGSLTHLAIITSTNKTTSTAKLAERDTEPLQIDIARKAVALYDKIGQQAFCTFVDGIPSDIKEQLEITLRQIRYTIEQDLAKRALLDLLISALESTKNIILL